MTKLTRISAAALAFAIAALTSVSPVLAAKPLPASKVNLNSASTEQLTALPGVGPKLAGRIVEYRQKSGGFKSAQELLNVQGIGEKNFAKLQPYVVVNERADTKAADASAKKSSAARSDGQ